MKLKAKSNLKKHFSKILIFAFFITAAFSMFVLPTLAKCPENVVPNPLDPECNNTNLFSIGFIANRFIIFSPYIVALIAVACYVWGAIKIILAQDDDARKDGIKIWVNVTLGLIAFFSIGLVLLIVSIITGFDLLKAIGQ